MQQSYLVFSKHIYKITLKEERKVFFFKVLQPETLGKHSLYFPPIL